MGVKSKILQVVGRNDPSVGVLPLPVKAQRAPTTDDLLPAGQLWLDESVTPNVIYTSLGGGTFETGGNAQATETVAGIARLATAAEATAGVDDTTIMTPAKVALVAIAGAPDWSEVTKGIVEKADQAEAEAGTNDDVGMTPLKVFQALAGGNAVLDVGAVTSTGAMDVDTTGAISLDADAASNFSVDGAGIDLTLASAAGRVVINGEEAAADAVRILSAAGGLDVDVALQMSLVSSQNAATAIVINATAGGIDITAAGAATEDIDLVNTSGSINLTAGENVADAIVLNASAGGIDITAAGAATEDIDITNTAGSIVLTSGEAVADSMVFASSGGIDADAVGQVNIASSQNAADAIVINASAGGIDITNTGTAGEDIDIASSGASVNLSSTENAALAITLNTNGGTSETIRVRNQQGTNAASIELVSTAGGLTFNGGLSSADAININASAAGGGIDVDAGTAGFIVDTTGAVSLDSAAASNFTVTGAFDLSLISTLGSIVVNAEEAVADAIQIQSAAGGLDVNTALQMNLDSSQAAVANSIRIVASAADGGIDVDAGTGGITIDSTGALSLDGAGASNFSVTGAGIDLTLASSGGRVVVNGEEAAADALRLLSAAGGLDVDVALQMSLVSSQNAADAIVINASAGGIDITAAGAAAEDIDIVNTAGSINLTAGENIATSMVFTNTGMDINITGAAGQDFDLTNTGGSVNVTATENISSAIVINASGAASGMSLDAGTAGITLGTGILHAVTSVATAATPYAVLGTDYFITTDSTGGALEITLPAVPVSGRTLVVYDGAGQAAVGGNVTINGNGVNIAAGGSSAATKVLNTAYESYTLVYNGTIWCGQNVV